MRTNKRIRTVLYGDERLSAAELEVIHTPSMQRLYGLKQLGLADRVYIDASHSRIHHVVGVLEHVNNLVDAIVINLRRNPRTFRIGNSTYDFQDLQSGPLAQLVHGRKPVIRLIGLLHDLTHAPFGHTVEDEIQIVESKHDHPERQAPAFYRLLCQLIAWISLEAYGPNSLSFPDILRPFLSESTSGEESAPSAIAETAKGLLSQGAPPKSQLGVRLNPKQIAELMAHLGCAMTALLHLEALHKENRGVADFPRESEYPFQELIRRTLDGTEFAPLLEQFKFLPKRDAFMLDIVGNTVCADLLDYAARDSHYAALRLDYDPARIAENFTLVPVDIRNYAIMHNQDPASLRVPEGIRDPFEGKCLRTAISLISHKYRTDIPGELMNLLNVRFYVYERVIFHPTKSAAGSMLGTALQLLGWRKSSAGSGEGLPSQLRFVGDDVFLHDIRSALDFVLRRLIELGDNHAIDETDVDRTRDVKYLHNGIASEILALRVGQNSTDVRRELGASQMLFNRLAARRYYRSVYRALPSSKDEKNADLIAEVFKDPNRRYLAEREIEREAGLEREPGTITIHCPPRHAARKIANVFLTRPEQAEDGSIVDHVHKLKHIDRLDGDMFKDHQKAVEAVERMYGSMWRLNVYVAPEHLDRYSAIGDAAGKVLSRTLKEADPALDLSNDPNLKIELNPNAITRGIGTVDGYELGPLGEALGRICDNLVDSHRLTGLSPELYGSPDQIAPDLKTRIEEAILSVLRSDEHRISIRREDVEVADDEVQGDESRSRVDMVLTDIKVYIRRIERKDADSFKLRFGGRFDHLEFERFEKFRSMLKTGIDNSIRLKAVAGVDHKRNWRETLEVIDELLSRYEDRREGGQREEEE